MADRHGGHRQMNSQAGRTRRRGSTTAARASTSRSWSPQQHRSFLRQLYDQKKIWPRVRVTAADMRRYYDRNRAAVFTIPDAAQFE